MDPSSPPPNRKSFPAGALPELAVESFLDSIIENIPDMIFVKDAEELRFVRFNRAGEELLGYSREELIGKNDYDFFPPEEANFFVSRDRAVLASGQLVDIPEEPIHTRHKGMRLLHTKKIPILGANGKPLYLLGISEDITDRRRSEKAESALYRSRNLEAIGRLAGGVAHDFNNLIMGILGVTAELKETATSVQQLELDEILRSGERAAALTRQLLTISRRQLATPQILKVNAVVQSLELLLRRLIGVDITISIELDPNAGSCRIDSGQLEQILLNLALNARDAMPNGGTLAIVTRRLVIERSQGTGEPELAPGPYTELTVKDNGFGMDPDTLAHVFEPFFSTKPDDKGTGLGLATVYGIIKQTGGEIRLESAPGAGTRVCVWLPEAGAPEETDLPLPATDGPAGKETVMVVEDEDLVRRMVVRTLQKAGYQVLQASDGRKGLAELEAYGRPVDLLLTDVIMPGLNGHELADQVSVLYPSTKVLFISGYTKDVMIGRDLLRPGVAFLQKVFTGEKLRAKVREVLDQIPSDDR